jgi:hypothetical protein
VYVSGKIRPVETSPGVGGREIKENDGEGEIRYNIFDIL